jgi:myxalamid-type nonribosomal peptide synthetase MxaA
MKELHGSKNERDDSTARESGQAAAVPQPVAARGKRVRPPELTPQHRGSRVPLSYGQERLWFLEQLGLVGPAYNLQRVFRLRGSLDVAALQAALTELIRRHQTLRTRFESIDGMPVQVIDDAGSCRLEPEDLSALGEEKKCAQMQRRARAEAQRTFDLTKDGLLRALLLKLAMNEHILVLTTHHIVSDGWSWAVLTRELGTLYGAYSQGRPSPLPQLPIQYADYAIWQRQVMDRETLRRHLDYWRERLSGAPPELPLPTDRPRPSVASFAGARVNFELSHRCSRALKELARQERATLFMVMLAAYQVLLARYCGQTDVVVGSPVAGRTHARTEGMIGFFVNTLVLRSDLSGNPSFRELLGRVKEVTLGAYAHQDLPFDQLVLELSPQRNLSRQPLFQVVLAMQNYPQEQLEFAGLTWSSVDTGHVAALFDLALHLVEGPGALQGTFVYATDLFDASTLQRMAAHLRQLLEGVVADPDCRIQELPMLPEDERERVLQGFNQTQACYPHDRPIHELFEDQVRRSPDAVAALYQEQRMTYRELNQRANQLARQLRAAGVAPGDFVPVQMSRSLQVLIAQIAVLKCGGVYVPIDPGLPAERRQFMIRDCSARHVVCDRDDHDGVASHLVDWINCTTVAQRIAGLVADDLDLRIDAGLPAYVMYTSGSTGTPKGVLVAHHSVNRLAINNGYADLGPGDVIAHHSNPAFDASTFEVWSALLNGASILIVEQSVVLDGERFAELLKRARVTAMYLSVGLFSQYTQTLAPVFPTLRYLMVGGDSLEPAGVRRVLSFSPPRQLLNVYGPTESTTFSTSYHIEHVPEEATQIPIGRPISNARIYILDEHRQPVPIGIPGELYIGGAGVACGYLNRPAFTAERFVPDPFGDEPGARLYRTGDLGRWRADGVIEFLGRNDGQVKIRGYRIELGEIEARLAQHPLLSAATVLARQDASAEKRLVAYVVPSDMRNAPAAKQLRAYLEGVLPEYMVPSAFVVLEALPLTSTGKVDRRALPVPAVEAYASREYEAPVGQTEQELARIWQELLGVARVGRDDSFFDLGGHSLLAIKALFLINQRFGSALRVIDLYHSPTIHKLAECLLGGSVDDIFVELSGEAVLGEEIAADPQLPRIRGGAVLLTGSTGFVGRFLLTELLRNTDATIYCLVRAASGREAQHRLRATLARWDLWEHAFQTRIIAVPGDLRLPRLGIDDLWYQVLCAQVDTIYHCATSMNHLETYTMARPANVDSIRQILMLATTRRLKLVNYISTLSVFSARTSEVARVVAESSPIEVEKHSSVHGYAASKWVGEKMFMTANERGIPCNVFRLGLVWADSREGRYDELQRDYRIFKSCLLSGYGIEDYQYDMSPTPVDYVARAVVFLAGRHPHGRGVFHVCAPDSRIERVFERCNAVAGTALELVPFYDWIGEMKRLHHEGRSLPIVPLIECYFSMTEADFYENMRRTRFARVRFDCSRTHAELEQAGIVAPGFTDELLRRYIQSMIDRDPDLREIASTGTLLQQSRGAAAVRLPRT